MRYFLFILTAALTGFAGGYLGTAAAGNTPGAASTGPGSGGDAAVVRARGFELVDGSGRVVSRWGLDRHRRPVLSFSSPDNSLVPLALFGLSESGSPVMTMSGEEGKPRIRLSLTKDAKPQLIMEDETGPRLLLGVEKADDWGLIFGPDRVRIGTTMESEGGKKYVRGFFQVNTEKVPRD